MSLRQKTERAVRRVLQDAAVQLSFLLSQENQTTVATLPMVNIQAVNGPNISPKTRIVKMQTFIAIRSSADKDPQDLAAPQPEVLHAANVDAVMIALNVSNLADLLSAAVPAFSCQGVIPRGQVDAHPPQGERSLCDGFLYELWVSEASLG